MGTVQLTTTPAIKPNVRNAYTSLLDMGSWWAFEVFDFIRQNGWAVKWTSTGLAGPANAADATNRLASKANFVTRATAAAAPQSWFVVEGTDVQTLVCYQGATDDILRISYSPGKLFTLAATPTHQPTATDEVIVSTANSIVNATTSADRVMSIWSTATMWSCAIYRSGALVNDIGVEKINPLVSGRTSNPIFMGKPYVGYRFATLLRNGAAGSMCGGVTTTGFTSPTGLTAAGGFVGMVARVYTDSTKVIRVGGGVIGNAANGVASLVSGAQFQNEKPALQNAEGSPLIPAYLQGEVTATGADGFLGTPIDWWIPYTAASTTPAAGDQFNGWDPSDNVAQVPARSNWLIACGPASVRPWRNVAATMETI